MREGTGREGTGERRSALRHLYFLLLKNLKGFFRNRVLLLITFLTPILLISILVGVVNLTRSSGLSYNIAFLNLDTEGIPNPHFNLSARASVDVIDVSTNASSVFNVHEKYNGRSITYDYGMELYQTAQLDAFIVLPANFSEIIFGSTWWYRTLKANNFENMSEVLNNTGMNYEDWKGFLDTLNTTDFPVGYQPNFMLYLTTDPVPQVMIANVITEIVNNLLLAYNALNQTAIDLLIRNGIPGMVLTPVDFFLSSYIIISGLMPITAVAMMLVTERKSGTLAHINRTLVTRGTNIGSLELAQIVIFTPQILITMGSLLWSGVHIHPDVNWGLLFLNCLDLSFISISIGILIGVSTKSEEVAGVTSFLVILVLQLVGGTYFRVDPNISQYIPTRYAIQASQFILLEGQGFDAVSTLLGINLLFGILFFVVAMVVFRFRKYYH